MPGYAALLARRSGEWIRRWRFSLGAWAIWRLAHLAATLAFGGHPVAGIVQWDGNWYLRIARSGYRYWDAAGRPKATAFFPLLPWVTRAVQFVTGSETIAVVVVTNLVSLAAVMLVWRAVSAWRGERVGNAAVVVLLAYPSSLFLWGFFSEGMLVALSAAAFLAQERDRPWSAGALAAAAAMTRIPGLLLTPVLLIGEFRRRRRLTWRVAACSIGVFGLVPVMLAQSLQAGNALAFLSAGRVWGRHLALPWSPLLDTIGLIARRGAHQFAGVATADVLSLIIVLVGALTAFVRRWPLEAAAWALLMAVVPLCSGLTTSASRYVLAGWPAFAAVAELGLSWPRLVRVVALTALGIASLVFLWLSSQGHFIG
jgi:hypothetical protein